MCYKTDKIERFLDCAFGFARNDRMRDWNGNVCYVRNRRKRAVSLICMPDSSYP